eukprot:1189547-Prorocentrum_minimum.AAC.1
MELFTCYLFRTFESSVEALFAEGGGKITPRKMSPFFVPYTIPSAFSPVGQYVLMTDQSYAGSMGIFSRRTNHAPSPPTTYTA